ncbi:MAG: hypothetical protein ASARMPRED_000968 [Alectoria sarmentosa]|nr:MAG: hypothetical protein ASARMPRED_000968 [Alectoria sarmentosa]
MVRATAAAVRANIGDNQITRDVPESERKSDEELLEAGIESANPKATNRDRWREAPYCWNEKGFLYEEHHHLGEERDPTTIEYIWDDYPVEIWALRHRAKKLDETQSFNDRIAALKDDDMVRTRTAHHDYSLELTDVLMADWLDLQDNEPTLPGLLRLGPHPLIAIDNLHFGDEEILDHLIH